MRVPLHLFLLVSAVAAALAVALAVLLLREPQLQWGSGQGGGEAAVVAASAAAAAKNGHLRFLGSHEVHASFLSAQRWTDGLPTVVIGDFNRGQISIERTSAFRVFDVEAVPWTKSVVYDIQGIPLFHAVYPSAASVTVAPMVKDQFSNLVVGLEANELIHETTLTTTRRSGYGRRRTRSHSTSRRFLTTYERSLRAAVVERSFRVLSASLALENLPPSATLVARMEALLDVDLRQAVNLTDFARNPFAKALDDMGLYIPSQVYYGGSVKVVGSIDDASFSSNHKDVDVWEGSKRGYTYSKFFRRMQSHFFEDNLDKDQDSTQLLIVGGDPPPQLANSDMTDMANPLMVEWIDSIPRRPVSIERRLLSIVRWLELHFVGPKWTAVIDALRETHLELTTRLAEKLEAELDERYDEDALLDDLYAG